jgi:[ribosomal protein S5]-alanine N-acetyltransferase
MVVLETSRLILRQFVREDLDNLSFIFSDPKVMYFSANGVRTKAETETWIENTIASYQTEGFGLYAAIDRKQSRLIGYCGLIVWSIDGFREIEIGYRFTPSYWGKGLATEAAIAVRDYGFEKLGFSSLITIIQPENHRSIRVAEKLGMKYEKNFIFMNLRVNLYRINISGAMNDVGVVVPRS